MMEENKLSLTRMKLKVPEEKWISDIFEDYPDAQIDILNFFPYDFEGNIGNAILKVKHYKIDQIIEYLTNHPSISALNILNKRENEAKINLKTNNPYLLFYVIKCGGIVEFPIKIIDKYIIWTIISTREQLNDILIRYEKMGINYSILQIVNPPLDFIDNANELTFEESKILDTAIKSGFFEVPRKISLEELANHLGKSKSWTSELLRKIIKKKVKFAI
ncbi:MAG: helix-turn-helix domain-containing protein [Promethearchaeota archaeon]|jgi:predicted DNA binding protein